MRTVAELRIQAKALYKALLKVQQKAFAGDLALINAARQKTKEEFTKGRTIDNVDMLSNRLKDAKEVKELLEHNIIQAELVNNDKGGSIEQGRLYYRLKFRPELEINDGHMKGKFSKCC